MSLFEIKPKIYGAWQPDHIDYLLLAPNYNDEYFIKLHNIEKKGRVKNKPKSKTKPK